MGRVSGSMGKYLPETNQDGPPQDGASRSQEPLLKAVIRRGPIVPGTWCQAGCSPRTLKSR